MVNQRMKRFNRPKLAEDKKPDVPVRYLGAADQHHGIVSIPADGQFHPAPWDLARRLAASDDYEVDHPDFRPIRSREPASIINSREPVTIIISSYEQPHLTAKALHSVISHGTTIRDQILVVDDGSSPGTVEALEVIIGPCKRRDVRLVKLVRLPHPALARSRQVGRNLAKHPWVLWMDNDVEWMNGDPLIRLQQLWKTGMGAIMPQRVGPKGQKYGASKFDRKLHPSGSAVGGTAEAMYPEGACWLSRKSTFHLWRFDTALPCYEDVHVGLQMYRAGLKMICTSDMQVSHAVWGSGLWKYAEAHPEVRDKLLSEWADVARRVTA